MLMSIQRPFLAAERPELAESDGLGQAAGALDVVAGAVLDVVAELGLDPDRHGVGGFVAAVVEADVLDVRLADDLDPVAPAAAVHVVETPVPFVQEVGADERGEPGAVAAVPGGLDLLEQRGGVGLDRVGGERGVVLGGLGGGGLRRGASRSATRRRAFGPELLRADQERPAFGATLVISR